MSLQAFVVTLSEGKILFTSDGDVYRLKMWDVGDGDWYTLEYVQDDFIIPVDLAEIEKLYQIPQAERVERDPACGQDWAERGVMLKDTLSLHLGLDDPMRKRLGLDEGEETKDD